MHLRCAKCTILMGWLFTFFFRCCRTHFKTYVLNYIKIYFMIVHESKASWRTKFPSSNKSGMMLLCSLTLNFGFCFKLCLHIIFGGRKIRKEYYLLKQCQTNLDINQNEKWITLLFLSALKNKGGEVLKHRVLNS